MLEEKEDGPGWHLELLIELSAGNRESFWDLLQGLTNDDVTARQEEARKGAFRNQSSLWGVRARLTFRTSIGFPSTTDETRTDGLRLGGLIDFTRLRPVPWQLFRMMAYRDDGQAFPVKPEPLDPEITSHEELPILKRFCSDPLPEICSVQTEFGRSFDLQPGVIGNLGSVDCVFGEVVRGVVSKYSEENDRFYATMIDLQTPTEFLLFDLLLHKDLDFPDPVEVLHLDRLNAARGYDTMSCDWNRLPLSVGVTPFSPSSAGAMIHHYPGYRELLDYAFDRIEMSPEDFRGYRFQMTYPTIPSAVVLRLLKSPSP